MITWIFKSALLFLFKSKIKTIFDVGNFSKKINNYFPNQIMYKKNFRTEMFILQLDIRARKSKYIRCKYT